MSVRLASPSRHFLGVLAVGLFACGTTPDPQDGTQDADPETFDPGAEPFRAASRRLANDGVDSAVGPKGAVQVWYPTTSTSSSLHGYIGDLSGEALDGGTPACDTPLPVVVFSHGNGGTRYQSYFLAEHLAQRGMIVVAPDHEGNGIFSDFSNTAEVALRRPREVAQSFDLLLEDPDLASCVDAANGYAVGGHSFGGYTTLAVAGAPIDLVFLEELCSTAPSWLCSIPDEPEAEGQTLLDLSDDRVTAAFPLAPAGYETFGPTLGDIEVPVLIMGGSDDDLTPWDVQQQPMFDALTVTPRAYARLEGATHYGFSNACDLLPTEPLYCDGEMTPGQTQAITADAVTAFLLGVWDEVVPDRADVTGEVVR